MRQVQGSLVVENARFAVVASRFNDFITSKLVAGALDTLQRHGCPEGAVTLVRVPGSFELPLAARRLAEGRKFDAVVCLGCIIRGQTPHFDYVAAEASKGIASVSLSTGVPVAFGVVTADTLEQAIDRAGGKAGNKGVDAALTAIEMVNVLRAIDRLD